MKLFGIRLALFTMTIMISTGCRHTARETRSEKSGLASISVVNTISSSKVVGRVLNPGKPSEEQAAFYFVEGSKEEEIEVKDKLELKRLTNEKTQKSEFRALWLGVEVGRADADGQNLEICGSLTNPDYDKLYSQKCDVTYVHAGSHGEKHLMILGLRQDFYSTAFGRISPEKNPVNSSSFSLTRQPDRIDISAPATNEINQGNTGTCLYNSTAGIAEWYRNFKLGRNERLSAIDVLARLDNLGRVGEVGAVTATSSLSGIVIDPSLPTQYTYNQFQDFDSSYNYGRSVAPGLTSNRTAIPSIRGTTLFMRSQPALGQRGQPGISSEEMQMVRSWLFEKKRPVQFFAYYGSVWHAIIALGWDDTRNMILIKDSLDESGQKAQWKDVNVYQSVAYGAVGTEEIDQIAGSFDGGNRADNGSIDGRGPINNDSPGLDAGSSGLSTNSTLSTVLAREEGSLRLYLYSQKHASYLAILGADGRWYYADHYYVAQNSWLTIGSVAVSDGWIQQRSVKVFAVFQDGTQLMTELAISDVRQ